MASFVIGRDTNVADIIVPDPTVSRSHLRATLVGSGRYLIEDLNSSGGTFVRRGSLWERVTRGEVGAGDTIRLASFISVVGELLRDPATVPAPQQPTMQYQPQHQPQYDYRASDYGGSRDQQTFGNAISKGLGNWFVFRGCATRSEFWYFFLFQVLTTALFIPLLVIPVIGPFLFLAALFLLSIAGLTCAIRRLHDGGMSGWLYLIFLVPFVGWIIALVLLCQPSAVGNNPYAQ